MTKQEVKIGDKILTNFWVLIIDEIRVEWLDSESSYVTAYAHDDEGEFIVRIEGDRGTADPL